jgi:hypothetical protein
MFNIHNFDSYLNQVVGDMPSHIKDLYDGCIEYINQVGRIPDPDMSDSFKVLFSWFDANYYIDSHPADGYEEIVDVGPVDLEIKQIHIEEFTGPDPNHRNYLS